MELGQLFKQVRVASGFNMEQTAQRLGFCGPTKISRMEKGQQKLKFKDFITYCEELEATVEIGISIEVNGIKIKRHFNEILD